MPQNERIDEAVQPVHVSKRVAYIDGLRGVAVGMVLVFHAWLLYTMGTRHTNAITVRSPLDFIVNQGAQGVGLFLVLSGLCLSLPLWQRRAEGKTDWFNASEFFARRVLRILPPYYVVLVLAIVFSYVCYRTHVHFAGYGSRPGTIDVVSHVLLVHNLTIYPTSLDAPFWSLGLEWQWYWVFPLALFVCVHKPRWALSLCAGIAVLWSVVGNVIGNGISIHGHVIPHHWLIDARNAMTLSVPARLFEFCCGILVAYLIVERRSISTRVLFAASVAPIALVNLPGIHDAAVYLGLFQPAYGVAFSAWVLLGARIKPVEQKLAFRPLVALGVVSYSAYLVHYPVFVAVWLLAPSWLYGSLFLMPLSIVIGLGFSVAFHYTIERPCMRRSTWVRVAPMLLPWFRWTDSLWTRTVSSKAARAWQMQLPNPDLALEETMSENHRFHNDDPTTSVA